MQDFGVLPFCSETLPTDITHKTFNYKTDMTYNLVISVLHFLKQYVIMSKKCEVSTLSKTVLITGASRGIGRACAVEFAKAGYRVAIDYNKSENQAKALVAELQAQGVDADCFKADVSDFNQVNNLVSWAKERFGSIDVLINNAGISVAGLLTDLTNGQWEDLRGVCLDGTIYCSKAVLSDMIKRQNGCIINISSVWGVRGASYEVAYSSVKAGIIGLTLGLAKEVAPSKIRVNCIAPGVIDTDMSRCYDLEALALDTPLGRVGQPEEIAKAALFLAEADFITGQVLGVDGGFGM